MKTNERIDSLSKYKRGLTEKEKLFCMYFVDSADAKQSAIDAGYTKNPAQKALTLLSRSDVADEIAALAKNNSRVMSKIAHCGYKRLAFGSIADAISLLYMESPTKKQLQDMDLFMVSEIKRPKDGAMEIKFYDRLKALEKLSSEKEDSDGDSNSLLHALTLGAQNLSHSAGEESEL